MKKLVMFLLVHINPNAIFSQDKIDTANRPINAFIYPMHIGEVKDYDRYNFVPVAKPDTLRAIVLVTLSPNGIAHSRMGFVVISEGKRPVYLDCQKRALKLPMVGWGYREVGVNEKVR